MAYYIGIDLGTSNSAIVTFDREKTRLWKSKEQTDITPSCIFIDKKGRQFVGNKAYKAQSKGGNEGRIAKQFKRFMGTSTKIEFADNSWTPEECSAEILKALVKCLPEDISNSEDRCAVITVPAAFDQMQNEATKRAAKMAGIGRVAVMQEPVAAIMSVMYNTGIKNGSFVIFDMGGGTLDVAIANAVNGKVDVVAHGGVAMCGGIDIDRRIVDNIIKPWMISNDDYEIPENFIEYDKYRQFINRVRFKAEEAKIELSSNNTAEIDVDVDITDENGEEIDGYIPVSREDIFPLMKDIVLEAVECARDTINKSGIPATDIEGIVFIGGPCNYKPLRDHVAQELGLKILGLDVMNPMTAVAEGAAIFAESIDWSSEEHERKSSNRIVSASDLGLDFKYEARTTKEKARLQIKTKQDFIGYSVEIYSVDTGWTSGTMDLVSGALLTLPLAKNGDNIFEVHIYDDRNHQIQLPENRITITRTMSVVGAITASHTISVEVKESNLSGSVVLDTLVHEGDKLPAKGSRKYKATERIKAGDPNSSLNLKLWEGNITSNVTDNKFIGIIKVEGTDLDYGAIRPGEEIEFNYTINEAGSLQVEINIERLGIIKSEKNFYDSNAAEQDMSSLETVYELEDKGEEIIRRVNDLENNVNDPRLGQIRIMAEELQNLADSPVIDPERVKKSSDNLVKAKQLLDQIRTDNLKSLREKELNKVRNWFENQVKPYCDEAQRGDMENMIENLVRLIAHKSRDFETLMSDIYDKGIWGILFRNSNEFIGQLFIYYRSRPYAYKNQNTYHELVQTGEKAIAENDFEQLRKIAVQMIMEQKQTINIGDMSEVANITRS